MLSYCTVGYICTRIDIRDSVERGCNDNKTKDLALFAFYLWPVWLCSDGFTIGLGNRIAKERARYELLQEAEHERKLAEKEVQKLLTEEAKENGVTC